MFPCLLCNAGMINTCLEMGGRNGTRHPLPNVLSEATEASKVINHAAYVNIHTSGLFRSSSTLHIFRVFSNFFSDLENDTLSSATAHGLRFTCCKFLYPSKKSSILAWHSLLPSSKYIGIIVGSKHYPVIRVPSQLIFSRSISKSTRRFIFFYLTIP